MSPSTVTVRSSASSSSADWVRGVARFNSSNSTTLANTGPGRNSHLDTRDRPSRSSARHERPGDVAGQEIGRALDAAERATDRPGDHLGEQRLADTRDVFDQQMSAGQHAGDGDLGDVVLAGDDRVDRPCESSGHVPDVDEICVDVLVRQALRGATRDGATRDRCVTEQAAAADPPVCIGRPRSRLDVNGAERCVITVDLNDRAQSLQRSFARARPVLGYGREARGEQPNPPR